MTACMNTVETIDIYMHCFMALCLVIDDQCHKLKQLYNLLLLHIKSVVPLCLSADPHEYDKLIERCTHDIEYNFHCQLLSRNKISIVTILLCSLCIINCMALHQYNSFHAIYIVHNITHIRHE